MDSKVNQYPIFALCPLCPRQWKCAQTLPLHPTSPSSCPAVPVAWIQVEHVEDAAELLWDGPFSTGISPWLAGETAQLLMQTPDGGRARLGCSHKGPRSLLLQEQVDAFLAFSAGKSYPTPRSVNSKWFVSFVIDSFGTSDHPRPRPVFSSKFSVTGGNENQPRWKATVATEKLGRGYFLLPSRTTTPWKSALRGQHGSHRLMLPSLPIFAQLPNLIPWGMLSSCCTARNVTLNSDWSKLSVRVFIFWNFPKLWELQLFTVTLRAVWSEDL